FKPDLLFLDIEMPIMNGFQVLDAIQPLNPHLVFTTAYDRYAVKAFKYSAVDYLLKPIDSQELIATINRISPSKTIVPQVEHLRQQLVSRMLTDKIALPSAQGYSFVPINNISYCEADDCYTHVYLATGEQYLITKTLGDIEEILAEQGFFRAHRQFLVNLQHIKAFVRGDGGYIVMHDGKDISIERSRKEEFTKLFLKL
ncbi:MAG: hypothetical protein RI894_694, partial [Bacteroidota bacterium]